MILVDRPYLVRCHLQEFGEVGDGNVVSLTRSFVRHALTLSISII